jgi:hypothetical protein
MTSSPSAPSQLRSSSSLASSWLHYGSSDEEEDLEPKRKNPRKLDFDESIPNIVLEPEVMTTLGMHSPTLSPQGEEMPVVEKVDMSDLPSEPLDAFIERKIREKSSSDTDFTDDSDTDTGKLL